MSTPLIDYLGLVMTPTAAPQPGDIPVRGASGGWTTLPGSAVAITREAPVNPMHSAFAGGALMDGSRLEDAPLAAAIVHAATAGRSGGTGSLFIPSGKAKISARLSLAGIQNIHIYGEGAGSFIQQQTDGEPIIEWSATAGVQRCQLKGLRLEHLNQQTPGSQPNAAAISLQNTSPNGFFACEFKDLDIHQSTDAFRVGNGVNSPVFWGNLMEDIRTSSLGRSGFRNAAATPFGAPTNKVIGWKHVSQAVVPTNPFFDLGAAGQWLFLSPDIEDWTDAVLAATGGAVVNIVGGHLERHHLVTSSVQVFSISQGVLNIEGMSLRYLFDGTGPYYFAFYTTSVGKVSGIHSDHDATGTGIGAGELRLVNGNSSSIVELGPRINNYASIVDFQSTASPLPWLQSDCGLPPRQISTTALPTASATYRGSMVRLRGATASIADRLVICRQDASGNYAWVDLY